MQTPSFYFGPFFGLSLRFFFFFEEKKKESNQKLTRVAKVDFVNFSSTFFFLVGENVNKEFANTHPRKSLKFQHGKRKFSKK